jgi:hypothetical protein
VEFSGVSGVSGVFKTSREYLEIFRNFRKFIKISRVLGIFRSQLKFYVSWIIRQILVEWLSDSKRI